MTWMLNRETGNYECYDPQAGGVVQRPSEELSPSPEDMVYQDKLRGMYCGTCEGMCQVDGGTACCHSAVKGWRCPHQPSVPAYGERENPLYEREYEEEGPLTYEDGTLYVDDHRRESALNRPRR